MRNIVWIACLLLTSLYAQSQSFNRGKSFYSGPGAASRGEAITLDSQGNTYVAGSFYGLTDFDPGPGFYTLTPVSATNWDAYIAKLDMNGNLLWAKGFGGTDFDQGKAVATDAAGNVYVTGYFSRTVDFDPGPGVSTFTATGSTDLFIVKLDPSGNFVWARQMGGTGDTRPNSIALDAAGNIYTSGTSRDADLDPGPGTYTLSGSDVFISKLDAAGNFVWARGLASTICSSISIDASGNLNMVGYFNGTQDFDPGPGTYTLATSATNQSDIFVWKLDAGGNFVWARQMGGPKDDLGMGVATDASGNVYTTGYFQGTADFDPGPATYTYTSGGLNQDLFISKLDASGNFVWAKRISEANGYGIALDAYANVYTTGFFRSSSNFNPGSGTAILTTGNSSSAAFISKLDASGNYILANNITNVSLPALSQGMSIAVDANGSVYTTGLFAGTVDFDPGAGTSSGTASSNGNTYIYKLCAFPALSISGATSVCAGQSLTLSAAGASSYSWSTGASTSSVTVSPTGTTSYTVTGTAAGGCSTTKTISVSVNNLPNVGISGTPSVCAGQSRTLTASGASTYTWSTGVTTATVSVAPTSNSTYTVTGRSSAGCVNTKTVSITVSALPVIAISGNTLVCEGKSTLLTGSGITSYTWNTGAHTPSINPVITAPTSFTLNGKDANGCAGDPAVISVSTDPAPVLSVSNGTICSGQSFTLAPTGALSYTYSGGSAAVSPASSANYTISGTGSNGCTGTVVARVTVNALPSVGISGSPSMLCIGNTATLSATGATSYSWSTGQTSTSIAVSPTVNTSYSVTGTGSTGCQKTTSVTQNVASCTAVGERSAAAIALSVYPNPARQRITISCASQTETVISVALSDAFGRLVKTLVSAQAIAGPFELSANINELAPGLYMVKVRTQEGETAAKLVVTD